MNYGFHLATGGVLAAMRKVDVVSNGLANMNSNGFKPDVLMPRERPAERIEGLSPFGDPTAPPRPLLERLGGGVRFDPDRIDLSQGPLERTDLETDFAIVGEGFFALAGPGDAPPARGAPVDLTRDGAFMVDTQGMLRRAGDGRAILGESGRPVKIDPARPFGVDDKGRVFQEGGEVARIRIVRPVDPKQLTKVGGNVLRAPSVERVPDGNTSLQGRTLEKSGVDGVTAMVELLRQFRLVDANLRMLQFQDSMNEQAIRGIARVA